MFVNIAISIALLFGFIMFLLVLGGSVSLNDLWKFARRVSLTFAIMILLPAVTYWGIQTWQPEPRINRVFYKGLNSLYKEFQKASDKLNNQDPASLFSWTTTTEDEKSKAEEAYEKELEKYEKKYDAIYFAACTIVGTGSLLVGTFITVSTMGIGFLVGGLSCLSMGYVHYWTRFGAMLRCISLIFILLVLTAFGYWVSRKEKR